MKIQFALLIAVGSFAVCSLMVSCQRQEVTTDSAQSSEPSTKPEQPSVPGTQNLSKAKSNQHQETAGQSDVADNPAVTSNQQPAKLTSEHLPNLVQVHQRVISGGLPEGEEAFAELAQRGIKTIISVDGMTPEVEMAEKYGMSYVHLPHGYDGIPTDRVWELAKAVQTCDGPIYIHCHHGKHRSPAAASVACVSAGMIATDKAIQVLQVAGTNPNYRGLFESAAAAFPLDADSLRQFQVTFQSVQEIPPMATAMVQLSHIHDHLKLIETHDWNSPPEHPDLDPAHEVLLLRELVTELLRTEEVQQAPTDFQAILKNTETASIQLEQELRQWISSKSELAESETETANAKLQSQVPDSVTQLFSKIGQDCKSCHIKFRDIPLGEK